MVTCIMQGISGPLLEGTTTLIDNVVEGLQHVRRLAGFLRGRAEFAVRPSDVFISSYPRSGTTWTQWILHLLKGGSRDFAHISQVCPWYERSLAIGELKADDYAAMESPRIFKSHLPYQWLPHGARYIYLERNGLDVATSYYHFYCSYLRFEGNFEQFFEQFLNGDLQYGSWFKHVAGWREVRERDDILWLRYEKMLASPEEHIRKIATFLDWDVSEARISEVLEASQFSEMKRREAQFDHATAIALERGVVPKSFIRKGKSGDGEGQLSERQLRAFDDARATARAGREFRLPAFLR